MHVSTQPSKIINLNSPLKFCVSINIAQVTIHRIGFCGYFILIHCIGKRGRRERGERERERERESERERERQRGRERVEVREKVIIILRILK